MVMAATLTPLLSHSASASGQTIAGARAQAAAIAAQLNSLGVQVSQLVAKYDQARLSLLKVNDEATSTQNQIVQTRSKIKSLKSQLATEAINSYVTSGNLDMFYTVMNESPIQAVIRRELLNTVTNSQTNTVASYQAATQSLQQQQKSLKVLQAQALSEFNQVAAAKSAAQAEVDKEKTQLDSINSTLATLVAQQQALLAQQAAAAAAAAAKARQLAANTPSNTFTAPSSVAVVDPAPGVYANPLRAIGGLSPERIDQGVDYGGYGPIYAIGPGVVLSTTNGGWPGGTYISYRLTSGPGAGLVVYVAEDVQPQVSVGQSVTSTTLLGTMYEGFDGIETGWADPSALGETMAFAAGQFNGSNSTAFGYNFSRLLESLGSRGGVLQNKPPTGTVPTGWPQW